MATPVESHIRDGTQSVLIAAGTALSPIIDLGGQRLYAIQIPAVWTAANLTFQIGIGGTAASAIYANMFSSPGGEYTVTAAASETIIVPFADFVGARYLKIRSGTNSVPVQQAVAATLLIQLAA